MKLTASLVALSLLAACSGTAPGSSPPPPNTITPPNLPADVAENNSFGGLLNGVRANFGAAPVSFDSRLGQAAQTHASDMLAQNYFGHTGLNGSTLGTRVSATGYNWSSLGENIAQGQTSQASVLNTWEGSTDHHNNNVNPVFEDFGLGRAGTGGNTRWVLVLGREQP